MKILIRRDLLAGWGVFCPTCGYGTHSLTHAGAMKMALRHAVSSGGASADPLRQGGMFTVRDAE